MTLHLLSCFGPLPVYNVLHILFLILTTNWSVIAIAKLKFKGFRYHIERYAISI